MCGDVAEIAKGKKEDVPSLMQRGNRVPSIDLHMSFYSLPYGRRGFRQCHIVEFLQSPPFEGVESLFFSQEITSAFE